MTRLTLIPSKMLVLMSLFITGVHANEDQSLIKDTPFVSGQAFKKGFFWYGDPARKTEEEIMETTPPLSSSPQSVQEEKIELNSKWLKDNMPRLLTQAMDNPTPENLSRFYTAQRLMLDIGTRFSDKSKDYFLKNPMMSEKRRQPVEKVALDAHRTVVEKKPANGNERYFHKIRSLFLFPEYLSVLPRRKSNSPVYAELLFCRNSSCQHGWQTFTKWVVPGFFCT